MPKDKAPPCQNSMIAANDNNLPPDTIDAALTRIAEAIGRHIAREHIRMRKAANDNEPVGKNLNPSKR